MSSLGCRVCSVKCGGWGVKCRVQSVEYKVWSVKCESVKCKGGV